MFSTLEKNGKVWIVSYIEVIFRIRIGSALRSKMVRKTTGSVDKFRALKCHKKSGPGQAGTSQQVLLKKGRYPSSRENYAFFLLRAKDYS
jgi:hypothetical protein